VTVNPLPTANAGADQSICNGDAITLTASGGVSYNWDNGVNQGVGFTPLLTNTYTVTVTDGNNCTDTDFTIITVNPLPIADAGEDKNICDGGAVDLTASGGVNYLWNTTENTATINVNPTVTTTYSVTVSDINNCESTDNVTVNVNSALIADAGSDVTICKGQSTILNASGGVSYNWSPANSLSLSSVSDPTASPTQTTTYTVTVSDGPGCEDTDQVIVTVLTVNAFAGNDATICAGDEILLSASGGISYAWSPTFGLTSPNTSTTIAGPQSTTVYTVYVTDVNGCTETDDVVINVLPTVEVNTVVSSNIVCPGDEIIIEPFPTSGIPPYVVHTFGGTIINTPIYLYPNDTLDYQFYVTDQCGTTIMQTVHIDVHDVPSLDFHPEITSGCQPLLVNFNNLYYDENFNYTWNFGDNEQESLSFEINPSHVYEEPGIYDVSLSVVTNDGCESSTEFTELIHVYEKPEAKFEADPKLVSVVSPRVLFSNLSTHLDTCIWSFGDGDTSSVIHPLHSFPIYPTGEYNVELIIATDHGCRDSSYTTITISNQASFYAPTGFTPDHDGINDYFKVFGSGINNRNFKMQIFDRWGEIIFESEDPHLGWDGKVKGTKRAAKCGVYTWLVTYSDFMNVQYQKAGTVTLIR